LIGGQRGALSTPGVRISDMTMLTHAGGRSGPTSHLSGGRDAARAGGASAHMAMLKRFCMGALATLIVGSAVVGIIALKTAVALSRLNY
jgi:hypothetical protein